MEGRSICLCGCLLSKGLLFPPIVTHWLRYTSSVCSNLYHRKSERVENQRDGKEERERGGRKDQTMLGKQKEKKTAAGMELIAGKELICYQ